MRRRWPSCRNCTAKCVTFGMRCCWRCAGCRSSWASGPAWTWRRNGNGSSRRCSTILANRAQFDKVAGETLRPESLVLPGDRDPADLVLRRTAALLADVQRGRPELVALEFERDLAQLQAAGAAIAPDNAEARYLLFAEACRLRRQIAFSNPLLAFDKLLFIKRHLAIYNHMCDQFYGIAARPGGVASVSVAGDRSRFRPAAHQRPRPAGRFGRRARPAERRETQRRPEPGVEAPVRWRRHAQRRRDRRRLVPVARCLVRRPGNRLCLRRMPRRPPAPHPHRSQPRPLGGRPLLPPVQGPRRRLAPGTTDRRHLERFRSLLDAQRPHRLHQRAARRVSALRADLPDVHRL